MSFRRRTYPEVLDNLLTGILGGVTAEQHPFPPPGASGAPYTYSLENAAVTDVISVWGTLNGQSYGFNKGSDYSLGDDKRTLQWLEGGSLPDAGTVFYVNYLTASGGATVSDLYVGSVVRTLAESVGLEIARLYAQIDAVYRAGFVDTASGSALENVVALLGIERIAGGRPAGEVEFTRSRGGHGVINIPARTRIITPDGEIEYETTGAVMLAETQNTIRVTARDLEINSGLEADSLTVLPVPIAGIASVTNPAPTTIATQDETDAELRTRAKNFLHGSERATLGAIKQAVARQGITADVDEAKDKPGLITVTPHTETMPADLYQRLLTAIEDVRPAGVKVELAGIQPPRKVDLELRITTVTGLLEQDLRRAHQAVRDAVTDYFQRLPAKEPGSVNRIVGLAMSVPAVEDVRIMSAKWDDAGGDLLDRDSGQLRIGGFPTKLGELRIANPDLPTILDAMISYPEEEAPPDPPSIRAALAAAVTYLNESNAREDADAAKREISYGKLLYVVPLPAKPGATADHPEISLTEYYRKKALGETVSLPDESAISPYRVEFVFTQTTGLSRIMSAASAKAYVLTPLERISLSGVEVRARENDA